ncbi:YihY/virulence factor BrkB family protein [Schlesneria sp. T3-172]|uniref:YihY/virulence factor BrkB family protein n=2 Tax=Schlesneria TaxID=656899 RepID=UPI0037CB4BB4
MFHFLWRLVSGSMSEFVNDRGARLGAALAFYSTFSVAPLLVISIGIASLFFGADAVQGQLKQQLDGLVGEDSAEGIQAMITAASKEKHVGLVSSILGVVALLFGATGVFVELKDSMNTIWGVKVKPGLGVWGLVKDRALSFAMVLSIGFLLLVSLCLSTLLSTISHWIDVPVLSPQIVDYVSSSVVIPILFMFIFKFLPDAHVKWQDVWIGAIVTSLLFTFGRYLIGLYLAKAAVSSAYGAAGSLAVFLLWTYYSSQILFFGAEFTQVYAQLRGHHIVPTEHAVTAEPEEQPDGT